MVDTKTFQKWLDRVTYDMDTAKAMLQTGRLVYAIFMCQQSLEKCFKALLAYKDREVVPIHNLRRLAELSMVNQELDEATFVKLDFFRFITSTLVIKKICNSYLKESPSQWSKTLFNFRKD